MKNKTTYADTPSSIEHPSHSIPDEIAESIRSFREADLAALNRQDEIAKLSRPNQSERGVIAEARQYAAEARGFKVETIQKIRELGRRKADRVKEILDREVVLRTPFELHTWDSKPPQPAVTDPTFWWARTDWWHPDHFSAGTNNNGLQFNGGVSTHDGDLHNDSFGAVALFELQADRIPTSLSGRWISTPHVELFGGLLAHTANYIFEDAWSKCWLHRDQQIFQWGFGQNGPVPIVLGQGHEFENLVFEEDKDRTINVGLRGFQLMPPVSFINVNRASSLWARLEIRFDIQTEGAGSLLWIDPQVLLRTFQWPLTPL